MSDWSAILNELGEDKQNYYNSIAPPIIQTSNFAFTSVADFRSALQNEFGHHVYTRGNNPTVAILRKKLAAMEHTEDALVFSSGSAAIAAAILSQVQAGDHVICVQSPYSWTFKLLKFYLPKFGVITSFVDGTDPELIREAIRPETRVLFLESPNSMTFELQDLEACARIAKESDLVTIIDNSYCSPFYQNPADFGIDLVTHSATKYLNGHSDVVCGVVCGSEKNIRSIFKNEYMTLGAIISPLEAAMVLRGLRTLPLRMERSNKTAAVIVDRLAAHPNVEKVLFPFHKSFPQYDLAQKQMRGTGGLFSIMLKADHIEQAEIFSNALRKFPIAASWGGYESLQMPACGFYNIPGKKDSHLPWNLIRLYAGLEDPDYLWADLKQALEELT